MDATQQANDLGASATNEQILGAIRAFCRETQTAESTFGRRVVNDGKLVSRLRDGARITTDTLGKVRTFLSEHRDTARVASPGGARTPIDGSHRGPEAEPEVLPAGFRFFDNRQKYQLFVSTCSEKADVAARISLELANIHPAPPALRVFDAGVGDGTVLARVMRALHARFPTLPLYIVAKEISYEDVRLALDKMPDRLFEHPATVLVLTNLYYAEAPWLTPRSPAAAQSLIWKDVVLTGNTSDGFAEQIGALESFLAENWRAGISRTTGNPVYQRPIILTIHREDHTFLLDHILPRPGRVTADYDLVIASQPYRARASAEFKAKKVIAPLARALRAGGRLIGIHSYGNDPGLEIVRGVWPDDNPFTVDRHAILKQVKHELGAAATQFNFNALADARSLFRYHMHTLPDEVSGPIGTSTLFAAWNAAIYVAQIEDARLSEAIKDDRYLEATDRVLKTHGGLWFNDETYVISRRRG